MTHEIRLVRLLTRQLYKEIESQPSWHSPFQLPKEAADELNFWLENITERNGFTFKPRPTTTKVVFTDTSSTGYGGFIARRLSETLCVGKFNETEMSTGSTERELAAVDYVLKSFGPLLSNESVQFWCITYSLCRKFKDAFTKNRHTNIWTLYKI